MAKVTQETNLAVEDLPEVEENQSEKDSKQKYFGGYETVYKTVAEAKENPVTLEDGTTPTSTNKRKVRDDDGNETGEIVETEVDTFKLFEIRDYSDDTKIIPVAYLWSRSNQTALAEYAEIELCLEAGQYGAKRGRAKIFKPDQGIVALATQMKAMGDQKYIDAFIAAMPEYTYIFKDVPQPETI